MIAAKIPESTNPPATTATALDRIFSLDVGADRRRWGQPTLFSGEARDHLAPLLGLKLLYRELKLPRWRKRQPGFQYRKDGTLQSNQQRMGPLTFEARLMGLERILGIQNAVNWAADTLGRPGMVLIDAEEEARIRELIAAKTWPNGWTGGEPNADVWLDQVNNDGSVQPVLFRDLVGA